MRIHVQPAPEQVPITHALGGGSTCHPAQQGLDLVHQGMVVQAGAIPFDQREFGIVAAARLAVPVGLADLIDRAADAEADGGRELVPRARARAPPAAEWRVNGALRHADEVPVTLLVALAYVTLAMLPAIAFYLVAERHIVAGLTAGSVKG